MGYDGASAMAKMESRKSSEMHYFPAFFYALQLGCPDLCFGLYIDPSIENKVIANSSLPKFYGITKRRLKLVKG